MELSSLERRTDGLREWTARVHTACFGDLFGSSLFIGSFVVFVLLWRVGIFLNDTYVMTNALSAVGDGSLYPTTPVVGDLDAPGAVEVGDDLYGRNYGQVVLAVPVLWIVEFVDVVVSIRAVLVAGWSVLVALLGRQLGRIAGRERAGTIAGLSIGGLSILANLVFWKPFYKLAPAVFALQLSTILWASLTVLIVYRLLARIETPRVGAVAAAVTMLASPVLFWSSTAKRHSLTAVSVVLVLYLFYRSRQASPAGPGPTETHYRALCYVTVGLYAWTSAGEAFTMFVPLLAVDLSTATRNDPKSLVLIGVAFLVSLVPFFLTNLSITGKPLEPPALALRDSLATVDTGGARTGTAGAEPTDTTGQGKQLSDLVRTITGSLSSVLTGVVTPVSVLADQYLQSLVVLVTDVDRVFQVFVRSGYRTTSASSNSLYSGPGMNLSVLESAPILGALVLRVGVVVRDGIRQRSDPVTVVTRIRKRITGALLPVDWLVLGLATSFVLVALHRLPIHHSYTTRYLHPVYPLAIYGMFRLPVITQAVEKRIRTLVLAFEAVVLLGLPVVYGLLYVASPGLGDVYQSYAVVGLVCSAFVIGAGGYQLARDLDGRLVAVSLGCAAGVATVFYVINATILVHYGISAFPFLEKLFAQLRFLVLRG
jgi:4-amino-4-deoxy-L-arabinose transferase-like glycosyltransferase